jgi:two-component system phosphate regulon sensor histidine kinase PhoR
MFRQIRWRIACYHTVLIVLAMGALSWYVIRTVRDNYLADLRWTLVSEARGVGEAAQSALAHGEMVPAMDRLAKRYSSLLGVRVTIIAMEGTVLGDSEEDWALMDNHADRPEVQQAFAVGEGVSVRFSRTVGHDMMYAAVRGSAEGIVPLVARASLPLRNIEAAVARLRQAVLVVTLAVVVVSVLLALAVAETTARPVRRLTELAQRLADGDLGGRIVPGTRDEVGTLARAFNRMADRLGQSFATLAGEHERLSTILEHMADGILITDEQGRVTLTNPAAERLIGTDAKHALGQTFAQVVRDYRLIEAWQCCRSSGQEHVEAVDVDHRGLSVRIIVTRLPGPTASECLVVLQDLTEIRRADIVRADFVSNVSHELRTPLASLKALVETLRDGAIQDPPAAERFLAQMETEVDAMSQMVLEQLELARIESGQARPQLAAVALSSVIVPAVERLRHQADRAGLVLKTEFAPDLPPVLADTDRIHEVVSNLVHNAIKFTSRGGEVTISAAVSGSEIVVSVTDTGVGIAPEDLPRVFERFYKADRARSGGGTGLGLSIAKHIVQGHGGRIWAESPSTLNSAGREPGTRVSFTLRVAQKEPTSA